MREIKFRAYVNNPIHGKGVFPVKSINFEPFVCEVVMGDEIINFFDFDDITLLQYTGLKDCNGKEIYEGDIIRDNDGFLWSVYFEDGMYCAKGGEYETIEYLIEFCPEWCEVIGNIYEHSHLLETEN
ncbi:hypothetical protein AXJ14_gp137 [Geobacillus virus E3]|uniref:hypothetical protein n=1 Tax=Geobacillus virus E3 TaxID=1572712 RepID=UPI000671BFC9|nr:hypothetical protein AXJ14_gp137 [Geobacillus virus E3]AJA41456.1 hypothetical protein E3_0137 [Geobacillus virus E3]